MKKIKTQLIGAGVLVSVLFFLTGCPNESKPSAPPKQYTVKFEAGAGGTLTAKTGGGNSITSGEQIYEGTKIIFTATPKDGFKVEKWEGLTAAAGTKTVTLTVTGNTDVKVTFTAAQQRTITFSAEPSEGGEITARRKDNGATVIRGAKVDEGTEIMFTATPSKAGKGYYIFGWSGEDLKVSPDKKTAELTVKNTTDVKVQFQKYLIENTNWEAAGILKDKSGSWKKFHLIISDGNTLTVFESSSGIGASKYGRMRYEPSTKTLSFLANQGGSGSIKFTSIPQLPLPADWEIQLENVTVQGLKLENQTATINVTFNKDNFIR
ncbi:hypothetical protein V1L52_02285 [Treponema sp. HNW]|uniref:InlB B-repeat-containing protein n=1 Tax=Treponema sp. HNW TaxID=3116654 RepID=UPI003D0EEC64